MEYKQRRDMEDQHSNHVDSGTWNHLLSGVTVHLFNS